jgi:hypothetical protein
MIRALAVRRLAATLQSSMDADWPNPLRAALCNILLRGKLDNNKR